MNILIKLMSIVSLVIAPTLATMHHTSAAGATMQKTIEMKITADGKKDGTEMSVTVNGNDPKNEMEKFIAALKADKMDDHGNLSVEFKNGELTINGKKQTPETCKKYVEYLDEKKDLIFSIKVHEK